MYLDSIIEVKTYTGGHFEKIGVTPCALDGEVGEMFHVDLPHDSYVAIVMLLLCVATMLIYCRSYRFLSFHTHNIFRMPRDNAFGIRETKHMTHLLSFFWLQRALLMSVVAFSVIFGGTVMDVESVYLSLGLLGAVFIGCYMLRNIVYQMVVPVIFGKKERGQFSVASSFLTAIDGMLLLPITLLHLYMSLSAEITLVLCGIVLISTLLIRIYKENSIFFRRNDVFLQFFLYLCTLEAVPIAIAVSILTYFHK